MKHITKILCLAAGLLGATSCSDFLDQTSPSEMTGQNVFGSAYYTGLAINKLYGAMAQDDTYSQAIPIVWSTNTDCELIDGLGDNATASNERGVMNYNSFAGWNRIARLWDAMYGISRTPTSPSRASTRARCSMPEAPTPLPCAVTRARR